MAFFGTKISLEIIFDDRVVRKQGFLHYKKADFTKWPYWLFFKGGTHDCNQKLEITPWFVLGQIFDDRVVRKQALLHYKKAYFTKWLYWLFFKGGTPRL